MMSADTTQETKHRFITFPDPIDSCTSHSSQTISQSSSIYTRDTIFPNENFCCCECPDIESCLNATGATAQNTTTTYELITKPTKSSENTNQ